MIGWPRAGYCEPWRHPIVILVVRFRREEGPDAQSEIPSLARPGVITVEGKLGIRNETDFVPLAKIRGDRRPDREPELHNVLGICVPVKTDLEGRPDLDHGLEV